MDVLTLCIGIAIGALIGFLIGKLTQKNNSDTVITAAQLKKEYVPSIVYTQLHEQFDKNTEKLEQKEDKLLELNKVIASQEQMIDQMREQEQRQASDYLELKKQMRLEFENLANKLLEEKSQKISTQNQQQLQAVLKPLQDKLFNFEQKIEHIYTDENKQRATLAEQIRQLTDLNKMMSEEAQQLTQALKGDSKAQGNWGELILERILEQSGLSKGREYRIQQAFYSEEGKRRQPDLIIHLPQQRHLVIDSKVSLTAYERYCSASSETQRLQALKAHLASLKRHLDELSLKRYEQLHKLNSLDYVLMFVPIEPAFTLAMQHEHELFYQALERNIILVSPSTLLATLRTVANLWRQEQQSQNALEIARQGGQLYDKFVRWIDELETLGQRLETAQKGYTQVMRRLRDGRGNLIERTQRLKELGAKASSTIPAHYLRELDDK